MNVLLTTLNSKYVHSNLALKYLYLTGREHCGRLDRKEFTINNSRDYIFTELVMADYDAVCFSCYIWNIEKTLGLAEDLKKARPEVKILLGGPEVSYDAKMLMARCEFIDFLISGEGEHAFGQWCGAFGGEHCYDQIKGLLYRQDGEVFVNPPSHPVDFAAIPFPYEGLPGEEDKVIYYESSRGCPFNCSYCISSLDRKTRELPLERVKSDLSFFLHKKVRQVKFLDRTFNWDRQRSLKLFRYLIDTDTGETNFHFEICADLLDDDLLNSLKEARKGLFQFEIGIQSTNEQTLRAVNRHSDVARVLSNVKKLVAMGNSYIHVDLIAGLPFEDYESFRNSFNDVYALKAEHLQLGFLKLLKGTEIRETADQYGYAYMCQAPYQVISNEWLDSREICKLKQIEEVLDLYHNRGGFEESLDYAVTHLGGTAFDFYERFAEYYCANGFQHRSHKKEDLYRIFYGFSLDTGGCEDLEKRLELDLERTMNFDAVKKFKRKGWTIL